MIKQTTLIPVPPTPPKPRLTPSQRLIKSERIKSHRLFKLYKSNKFNHFSDEDKRLLEKHYNIHI